MAEEAMFKFARWMLDIKKERSFIIETAIEEVDRKRKERMQWEIDLFFKRSAYMSEPTERFVHSDVVDVLC